MKNTIRITFEVRVSKPTTGETVNTVDTPTGLRISKDRNGNITAIGHKHWNSDMQLSSIYN